MRGRTLRRTPHWLALVAMLVQFIASYGHLHPEDFDFLVHGHGTPTLSADHGPTRAIGDPMVVDLDCPICAAMQMLGSSQLPEGTHLVPPLSRGTVQSARFDALWLTPPPHLLFETRGPPLT
jgi:hypothetical protein